MIGIDDFCILARMSRVASSDPPGVSNAKIMAEYSSWLLLEEEACFITAAIFSDVAEDIKSLTSAHNTFFFTSFSNCPDNDPNMRLDSKIISDREIKIATTNLILLSNLFTSNCSEHKLR